DTGSRVKDAGIDEEIDRDRCIVFGDAGLVRHLEIRLSQIHPYGPVDEWNDQDQARPLGRWQHFAETEHDNALVFRDDLEGEKQQEDSYQECNYERKVHTHPLVRCASRQRRSAETRKFREGYAWVVLMSSELGSGKRGHPLRASRNTNAPTKLARFSLFEGGHGWSHTSRVERPLFDRGGSTSEWDHHVAPSHVSIISSRASNSCPQVAQRIQSDSTTNSSMRTPMPPQSGHRARWTLWSS